VNAVAHRSYLILILILLVVATEPVAASDPGFTYDEIASRYQNVKLTDDEVLRARMHGECLVGLKNLNFVKRREFDPVGEWTNYRSLSLLEQFPPCMVLVMIEVAHAHVSKDAP
jgi:hypothetical protein